MAGEPVNQVLPTQSQASLAGYVNPTAYTQYGILPPQAGNQPLSSQLQGSNGFVGSRAGAIAGAMPGGFNFAQQLTGAERANADFHQNQAKQREAQKALAQQTLSTPLPDPSDPSYAAVMQQHQAAQQHLNQLTQPQGYGGFLSALAGGVQKLGHAVAPGMIPAPGGAPAPAQAAPVAAPQAGAPQAPPQTAIPPPVQGAAPALAQGGVMPDFLTQPPMGSGPGAAVPQASVEGQQPPGSTPGQSGWMGFASGGPIPAAAPPPPAAAPPPQQAPPQGMPAPYNPAMGPVQSQGQVLPSDAQDPSGPFNKYYQGLLDASLNDKGEPPGREAVPSPTANPNVPLQSAANNPAARKGVPEDSPAESGQPHSLSSGWYDQQDNYAREAASHAAAAGQDPNAVYQAMNNMTTSYLQTHIMREASAAAVAVQSGDMGAVEKALKNMYYYIPNGQELATSKVGGTLTYQNPIYPYLDKNGNPTEVGSADSPKNMVPVDAQHISMLAQAAANPMAIGGLIQQARIQNMEAQAKVLTAQGANATGQGRFLMGQAANTNANVHASLAPSEGAKNLDEAYYYRNRAAATQYSLSLLKGQNMDPTAFKAVQATNSLLDNAFMGTQRQVTPDDVGNNIALTGSVGKTFHDPKTIPPELAGATVQDQAKVRAWASGLVAANPKGMTPQTAVSVAMGAYRQAKGTHKEGTQTRPNVMVDPQKNLLHVWSGSGWQNYPLANGTAVSNVDPTAVVAALNGNGGGLPPPSGGASGGTTTPAWVDQDDAAAPAP